MFLRQSYFAYIFFQSSYLVAREVIDKLSSTVLRASAYLLGAFVAVHHFHMERSAFPGKAADRRHRHCDSAVVAG